MKIYIRVRENRTDFTRDNKKVMEKLDETRNQQGRFPDGFGEKLTTTNWDTINKSCQDKAFRDAQGLIKKAILQKEANGGQSPVMNCQTFTGGC